MGYYGKTEKAKTETAKKAAEEKVQIAVTGSYGEDSKIDYNDLNNNLRQIEGLSDILFEGNSIIANNKIEDLPIEVIVDSYTIEIEKNGNVKLKLPKPIISHTITPETQVEEGTEITITITATISEGVVTKITKPNGEEVKNVNEATYKVKENNDYEFIIEGSNGEKTIYVVKITNGKYVERFSDIYTETKIYTDKYGKTAKIPEGFAVGKSDTINTIGNGLVITDQIDEEHKSTGNEFVWVPVENPDDFKRMDGYESQEKRQNIVSDGTCEEPYNNGSKEEKEDYTAMYNSVINENNRGFYCREI